MKADTIRELVKGMVGQGVAIIFNDASVLIGKGLQESHGDGSGMPNLWNLEQEGYSYIIDGNEVASLNVIAESLSSLAFTKPFIITFNIGDIIRLKDDGETNYIITSTKEKPVGNKGLGIFDYEVKKDSKKTDGVITKKVFKENVYRAV